MGSRESSTTSLNYYSAILINLFSNSGSVYPVLCSPSRVNLGSSSMLNLYTSPKHDVLPKNTASKQKDSRLLGKQRAVNEQEMPFTHGKGRNTRGLRPPVQPGHFFPGLPDSAWSTGIPSPAAQPAGSGGEGGKGETAPTGGELPFLGPLPLVPSRLTSLENQPHREDVKVNKQDGEEPPSGPRGPLPSTASGGRCAPLLCEQFSPVGAQRGSVSLHESQCITSRALSKGFSIGNSSPNKLPLQPQEVGVSQHRK